MNEKLFTDQFGRLPQEWRIMRDCSNANTHLRRGGDSDMSYLQDHHQVSSFELAMNYDSSLDTPVSLSSISPTAPPASCAEVQWCRDNAPSLQYHPRGNDSGIYMSSMSMPMKSRNTSPPVHLSGAEIPMPIPPFVFDSPPPQCPPSPYWGSYSVSASQPTAKATPSPPPKSAPPSQSNISAPSCSQSVSTIAPHPHLAPQQQHQQAQHVRPPTHPQGQSLRTKREGSALSSGNKRQRKSPQEPRPPATAQSTTTDLTEADKLLLRLKDAKEEEKWDWKEMTTRFNEMTKGDYKVAALQMRHTRLVERMRVWTDTEVRALVRAKQQLDATRWKMVAANMLEYGCETKWSPRACQLKWAELHPEEVEVLAPPVRRPNAEALDADSDELVEYDENDGDRGRQPDGAAGRSAEGRGQPMAPQSCGPRSRHVPYGQQQNWMVRPQR